MPESDKHLSLKQILESRMKEWFGASITEYPSSGHELDVFAVTPSGVGVYIEVIWSHSRRQFLSDINMLQQSDAHVKAVVASPEILADKEMSREFGKVVAAQRRQNKVVHGDMLDGQRILDDAEYVDSELRQLFENLVTQARSASIFPPITEVAGEHAAVGKGEVIGLDIQGPALIKPGTRAIAAGEGRVTGTRIGSKWVKKKTKAEDQT
jgi:hypothetical protein